MTRSATIVTLALLSSVLAPVVVKATGAQEKPSAAAESRIETAAVTVPEAAAESPACARRVKVVYAGYGEAHAAACAAADLRR